MKIKTSVKPNSPQTNRLLCRTLMKGEAGNLEDHCPEIFAEGFVTSTTFKKHILAF